MPPLRWKLADLQPSQRLLLREADTVATKSEPPQCNIGSDQPTAAVRGRGSSKKSGGKGFRLTQPEPPEAAVLNACLRYLKLRKDRVAWVQRLNSGAGQLAFADGGKSQWMRFSWRGAPDLIGQMCDGRILCVEVKRPSGRLRPEQEAFLNVVRCQGGVAFVARSVEDCKEHLDGR